MGNDPRSVQTVIEGVQGERNGPCVSESGASGLAGVPVTGWQVAQRPRTARRVEVADDQVRLEIPDQVVDLLQQRVTMNVDLAGKIDNEEMELASVVLPCERLRLRARSINQPAVGAERDGYNARIR